MYRNVKVIDYKGTKYSGHWNGKNYPSQIEGRDDLHRIYVENAPIHITAGELKKLQSDEAACGKKIASGKIQDFFTWLEAQDIGTKKYAFTEALEAMREHTKTIETKKAANILRDLFAKHDV